MEIDPRFKEYCIKAEKVDAGAALDKLIKLYINACGISLGERSIAACAALYWIYRYKDDNPELPEKLDLKGVMALRSEEYRENKESIDKYDIACLGPQEILRISSLMLDDYKDELTRTALCMGLLFYLSYLAKEVYGCDSDDNSEL